MSKIDHTNTVCCNCGSNKTYMRRGRPEWTRYRDSKGCWDGKSYLCTNCNAYLNRYGTLDKSKIYDERMTYLQKKIIDTRNELKKRECCICGGVGTYIYPDGRISWHKNEDENGKWDGKSYSCEECFKKFDPKSHDMIRKSMRKIRDYKVLITDNRIEGVLGEAVVAKVRKLKVLSLELDNFGLKFDLSVDKEYNIIQVKFKKPYYNDWKVTFGEEHNFNTLFILCIDKNTDNLDIVYAIPEEELYGLTSVFIPKSGYSKWEKFKIDEESYNNAFHSLMSYLKHKEHFSIEDIRKWLEDD